MAKVREISWPKEYSDLKRIEDFMICGICYEYMDTSVMTPCSHNYCSLCIRKYLHFKAQCPACFHVFFEKDLYVNRTMDGIIQHYLQIREKLITLIEHRVIYNSVVQLESEPPSSPPIRPARSQVIKSPKTVEKKSPRIKEVTQSESQTPKHLPSTSKFEASSPSAVQSPKVLPTIAKIFSTPKRKEVLPPPSVNTKTVTCPVCSVDISQNNVNVHLDACLKRENCQEKEKLRPSAPKRPPLPKLVLRVMKDAELRKKMKEFGLPTQGDRRTLESRFTRYTTIYNAECDKLDPRSIPELIKQCEMEEKQERKLDSFLVSTSTTTPRFQVERNAKEEKIEEAQKNYRVANKSSFDKLIEEVKNRRKMETLKLTEINDVQNDKTVVSPNKPITSNKSDISENVLEKEENSICIPSNETAFQDTDTDSDVSCPLQHYRSDHPNVLTNINDSNSEISSAASMSPIKRSQVSCNSEKIANRVQVEKMNNIYEATTDDSTDDDIPSSPILNKSLHYKRAKLSNKTLSKSKSKSSSKSDFLKDKDKESREIKARDLCNSIINDFAFDDDSNEFVNKPEKEETKNIVVKSSGTSKGSAVNGSTLETENDICHQQEKFEVNSIKQKNVDNDVNSSTEFANFSFDILNADDSSEYVNMSTSLSLGVQEKPFSENIETLSCSSINKVEKENDAFSANENSHQSNNESSVCRPVRKRNRPARFAESQIVEPGNRDKMKGHLFERSQESDSPDNLKNVATEGSLKRRRGRSKVHSTNLTIDETQKPPKRPVRRRQAAPDPN